MPMPHVHTTPWCRYVRKLVSRTGSTDNHATSSLKFQILAEMLSVRRGCPALPRGEMWGEMGRDVAPCREGRSEPR